MVRVTLLVLALAAFASLAAAYSLTPNFAIGLGGSAADSAYATAVDASGNVFVGGTTWSSSVTSTTATGGVAGATTSAAAGSFSGAAANGYVAMFTANGTKQWFTEVTGASGGGQAVTAMAVGGSGGNTLYVCGTFTGAGAMLVDATGSHGPLTADPALSGDVFYAAISTTTGTVQWWGSIHSQYNDSCQAVAYSGAFSGGNVVFGGSAGYDLNTVAAFAGSPSRANVTVSTPINDGAYMSDVDANEPSGLSQGAMGFVARFNASTGGGVVVFPTTDIVGSRSFEDDRVAALAFSSYGDLYIGVNLFGQYNGGGFNVDPNSFGHWVTGINVIAAAAFGSNDVTLLASIQTNGEQSPGQFNYPVLNAAFFGAEYADSFMTGFALIGTQSDTPLNNVLAITGWVNGTSYLNPATAYFNASTSCRPGSPEPNCASLPRWPSAVIPSAMSHWVVTQNALLTSATATVTFVNPPGVLAQSGGMAYDAVSGHVFVASSVRGSGTIAVPGGTTGQTAAVIATGGVWAAAMTRVSGSGVIQWIQTVAGGGAAAGPMDAFGVSAAVTSLPIPSNPTFLRPWPLLVGSFAGNASITPYSASPLVVSARGGSDGLAVSFDDVDDCGLQQTVAAAAPYGLNACGVTTDFNAARGASLCLDEPQYPLCFCNMNVTSTSVTTGGAVPGFCNVGGWECAFTAPYYYGLLDVCNCPPAPNPSANPLNDVETRLLLCAPRVCDFGTYTGEYAQCLPLVLSLINTCLNSPATSVTDKTYMGAFEGLYNDCAAAAVSSTGPIVFSAAPAATAAGGAVIAAGAAVAAAAAHLEL